MKTSSRFLPVLFFTCFLIAISTGGVNAQTTSWILNGSNSWTTPSDWSNGVPNAAKSAVINDGNGPYIYTPGQTANVITIGGGSGGSLDVAENNVVGAPDTTGTLTATSVVIAPTGGGGYLDVDSALATATFTGTGIAVLVGDGATGFQAGTLIVGDGATLSTPNGSIQIGYQGSAAYANVFLGAKIVDGGNLEVGGGAPAQGGMGQLNINSASTVSVTGYLSLGDSGSTSSGTILLSDTGSKLTVGGDVTIGAQGNSVLTVTSGAMLISTGPGFAIDFGTLNIGYDGLTPNEPSLMTAGALNISSNITLNDGVANSLINFNQTDSFTMSNVITGTGAVNQQGTGTTILNAANTYAGTTTITSGTLQLGDGILNGTVGTSTVTDNAALAFDEGTATTLSNAISGTGTVAQNGPGTVTLSGNNTYGGATTIAAATTLAAGATTAFSNTSAFTVAGTLDLAGFNNTVASLAGTGMVTNSGMGRSVLTVGSNFASGITTFSGLIKDGMLAATGLSVGPGQLTLTNANTYSGGTDFNGGILIAGNSHALGAGIVTVSNGTLETDAAYRTLILQSNYIQNGIGTLLLKVNNTTSDEIQTAGTAALGGTLSLNQTAVTSQAQPLGTPTSSKVYTLLTSTGLTGQFAIVDETPLPQGETETLSYTLDDVLLTINQAASLFSLTGLTPNQQVIANNLNSLLANGNGSAITIPLGNAIMSGPGAAGNYLDELSPEKFANFTSQTAFNNASFETQAMDSYLAGLRGGANGTFIGGNGSIDASGLTVNDPDYDPALSMVHSRMMAFNPAPYSGTLQDVADPLLGGVDMKEARDTKSMTTPTYTNPWNFFVRGSVILAQGFSQTDVPHFDDNTESVVLGTDYRITPNLLVGLTAAYAHTDVTLDNNGSSATVDSYSPGFYASYADRGWYANLSGDYLHNAYTQSRQIAFLGQTATSAPQGNQGVANLDGGYDFHRGALTFGPIAGLQYTHLSVDGYNEAGSVADLSVQDNESDSLRSRLGGTLSYAFNQHGIAITPHLDASWQHEFLDQARGITSQFGFGGGSFAVRTNNPSRDSALIDLGVTADLNRTVSVFTDYIAQAGQDNYFGQSVQAGVKIGF